MNQPECPPLRASSPYPSPEVTAQNPRYALLLRQAISSAKSEMTSVLQYVYQSWRLKPDDAKLAALFAGLAGVEMHHLQLLGELVVLLGGDPRCTAPSCGCPWNGNMICYTGNPASFLRQNAAAEQGAYDTYLSLARQLEDSKIQPLLLRLSEDEALHRDLLLERLEQLSACQTRK